MKEEKKPMTKAEYQHRNQTFNEIRENVRKDTYRLQYHLQPPIGWLNDPNGLCQIGDTYHIYFQYTPFNPEGGTGLWGHMTTKDFIHYDEQEPAIYPDSIWDANGAYSGSAYEEEGNYYFFYTGNIKYTDKEYDYISDGREQNVILITTKDGFDFSEKKLIMTNEDFPKDMSKHVRDPQIIKRNGKYYMILGARDLKSKGSVLLFESENLIQWNYKLRFTTEETFGYMWECPNWVEINGKQFLIACPQGVKQEEINFANKYQCGYFPVEYEFGEESYTIQPFKQLDRGFDFYAPQVFQDHQGRSILIGWMGMPDSEYGNEPTVQKGWQHALTVPRELYVTEKGILAQRPVKELEKLRTKKKEFHFQDTFCEEVPVSFELDITLSEHKQFILSIREGVKLQYAQGILTLDMDQYGNGRTTRGVKVDNIKNIKILSDASSLEIFINDGEEVFTTRIYDSMSQLYCKISACSLKGKLELFEINNRI